MNPISSLRRAALGAAVAGAALGAVPPLASASPCTYDPVHKVASVVDSSGFSQLRVGVSANLIFTQDGGNAPANCVGGGTVATTANTDRINVFAAAKGASDGVVLDQSRGAFAPGASPEADGNSEIELALSGQSGHLSVFGTPGDDVMRAGAVERVSSIGALDFGDDDDDDVTFTASDAVLAGGDGNDVLSGQGYGVHDATRLPLGFSGGARPHGRHLSARGVEIMANRSLVTHSAKTLTAHLGMKFPGSLAGAQLRVAVQATDRQGHTQLDRDAGLIRVAK